MSLFLSSVLIALCLLTVSAVAETAIRVETLQVDTGGAATSLTGRISGDEIVDYRVRASAGQTLSASLESDHPSAFFNTLPPGSDVALFIGSVYGSRFETRLPSSGIYTIRVYLMRNAARRNETAGYTLEVSLANDDGAAGSASDPLPVTGAPFDRTLELQGVRFHVTSTHGGSINTLRIDASGLEIDNTPIVRTVDGSVAGAEVADLNADGSPEIYVYVTSAGSGSYGSLVAYSANQRKSVAHIHLPPITQDEAASRGYLGHDEFAVVENVLVRRFPVYRDGDTNAAPTGGTRQLQYRLVSGDAGWLLAVDRIVEY